MSRFRGLADLRLTAAALLLGGGLVHTLLAFEDYGSPDLISVFFLHGAAAAVIATALVLSGGPVAALGGLGFAASSLLAFGLSRVGEGVLGFRATGLYPVPEAPLALVLEAAALAVLALALVQQRAPLSDAVRAALPSRSTTGRRGARR